MIGNDVVDLNLAKTQSNWKRKGFLDKLFTKKEQEFIKNAKDSFSAVWLLWSMKESAYKIYSRQNNVRFFAPQQFECEMNNTQKTVSINSTTYFTSSTLTKNSIHTMAKLKMDELITSDFFKLENNTCAMQHNTTYKHLKTVISNQFNIPISQLKIEKNINGVPNINQPQIQTISISHHGIFGAFAFSCKVSKTL